MHSAKKLTWVGSGWGTETEIQVHAAHTPIYRFLPKEGDPFNHIKEIKKNTLGREEITTKEKHPLYCHKWCASGKQQFLTCFKSVGNQNLRSWELVIRRNTQGKVTLGRGNGTI